MERRVPLLGRDGCPSSVGADRVGESLDEAAIPERLEFDAELGENEPALNRHLNRLAASCVSVDLIRHGPLRARLSGRSQLAQMSIDRVRRSDGLCFVSSEPQAGQVGIPMVIGLSSVVLLGLQVCLRVVGRSDGRRVDPKVLDDTIYLFEIGARDLVH